MERYQNLLKRNRAHWFQKRFPMESTLQCFQGESTWQGFLRESPPQSFLRESTWQGFLRESTPQSFLRESTPQSFVRESTPTRTNTTFILLSLANQKPFPFSMQAPIINYQHTCLGKSSLLQNIAYIFVNFKSSSDILYVVCISYVQNSYILSIQ